MSEGNKETCPYSKMSLSGAFRDLDKVTHRGGVTDREQRHAAKSLETQSPPFSPLVMDVPRWAIRPPCNLVKMSFTQIKEDQEKKRRKKGEDFKGGMFYVH